MSEVFRFDWAEDGHYPSTDGDWVKHTDHLSAIAELRAEVEGLREARLLWGHLNDMGVDPRDKDELWVLLGKTLSPDNTAEGGSNESQ